MAAETMEVVAGSDAQSPKISLGTETEMASGGCEEGGSGVEPMCVG